ncbi:Chromodomain-helicase-DNA-binding protein Mi-2-like protein, partial [Frankliniella fusca]
MSLKRHKALVFWEKEKKTGIEPITSVPESSRFVGAATPVLFSGNKKFYPAKILMLSEDDKALEEKANAVAMDLMKKSDVSKKNPVKKRSGKKISKAGSASDRDIALALGKKAPVPKLQEEQANASKKAVKSVKVSKAKGQNQLDAQVMSTIKRSLFQNVEKDNGVEEENDRGNVSEDDSTVDTGNDQSDENEEEVAGPSDNSSEWVKILHKYDLSMCRNFLSDVIGLIDSQAGPRDESKQILKLLPIPDKVKSVELTMGSQIFIPLSIKEQLKVDFKNRPNLLAKNTLFALYGSDTFRTHKVTGRGNTPGTFTIANDVLVTVLNFVNRHVSKENQMKQSDLIGMINKRAREWRTPPKRKSNQQAKTNQQAKKCKTKDKDIFDDLVKSTSPFKVLPLKPLSQGESSSSEDEEATSGVTSPVKTQAAPAPAVTEVAPVPALTQATPVPAITQVAPGPATPSVPAAEPSPSPSGPTWTEYQHQQQSWAHQQTAPSYSWGWGPNGAWAPSGAPAASSGWWHQATAPADQGDQHHQYTTFVEAPTANANANNSKKSVKGKGVPVRRTVGKGPRRRGKLVPPETTNSSEEDDPPISGVERHSKLSLSKKIQRKKDDGSDEEQQPQAARAASKQTF